MRKRLLSFLQRVYSDFLMPDRSEEYRRLVSTALRSGYQVVGVKEFHQMILHQPGDLQLLLILRHDIDTDPGYARVFWQIEKDLGVNSSFYFRQSTLDVDLMQEIELSGSEASYHYEELATLAKKHCLKSRERVLLYLGEARDLLRGNLGRLRTQTGLPMTTLAAHGDFVNRRLDMRNQELLADQEFRRELGVEYEVYDPGPENLEAARFSDAPYPHFWRPASPLHAIEAGLPVVYVLTHPRHWCSHVIPNLKDDANRFIEGVRYARCR